MRTFIISEKKLRELITLSNEYGLRNGTPLEDDLEKWFFKGLRVKK